MRDIAVYPAYAFNMVTCSYDIWRGNGTPQAIAAAGCKLSPIAAGYCTKEELKDKAGWAYWHGLSEVGRPLPARGRVAVQGPNC
jgi:hypothetical protein